MDNVGSHKSTAVRDAIRSVGAHRVFLPAYSPDPNPIKQVFSKRKALRTRSATIGTRGDQSLIDIRTNWRCFETNRLHLNSAGEA